MCVRGGGVTHGGGGGGVIIYGSGYMCRRGFKLGMWHRERLLTESGGFRRGPSLKTTGNIGAKIKRKRIFFKWGRGRGFFCSGQGRKHGVFWSGPGRKNGDFRAAHTSTALIWEY